MYCHLDSNGIVGMRQIRGRIEPLVRLNKGFIFDITEMR